MPLTVHAPSHGQGIYVCHLFELFEGGVYVGEPFVRVEAPERKCPSNNTNKNNKDPFCVQ